jgi:hypothetical protein
MYIVGVDCHPSFQQIACLDRATAECGGRRLNSSDREAEKVLSGVASKRRQRDGLRSSTS